MTGKVPAFSTCREEQTGAAGNVGNGAAAAAQGRRHGWADRPRRISSGTASSCRGPQSVHGASVPSVTWEDSSRTFWSHWTRPLRPRAQTLGSVPGPREGSASSAEQE